MSRRPRYDSEGGVHHVMNRGVDRQPIFFADADRREFGQRLADIHTRFGVQTLAYALMGNHYHLLLRTPDGGLSQAMHHLGLVYVRRTNDRVGRDGPLFRSRFHSIPVTTDAYLAFAARYIHRNPLDLPGVGAPGAYRWSSYRTYLGHRRCPTFVDTSLVLGLFGYDRKNLAAFTERTDEVATPLVGAHLADLVQVVQLAIAQLDLDGLIDETAPRWLERTALILIADAIGDAQLSTDLDVMMSPPSPTARRMAQKRARDRGSDPAVRRIVELVLASTQHLHRAA